MSCKGKLFAVVWILGLMLSAQTLWAQSKGDLSKYGYAKELLSSGKYAQAYVVLEKIVDDGSDNPLYPNASYLQGLSNYKQGKTQEAREQLFKLTQQFPNWDGSDEAIFLLATIDFEWEMPEQALQNLQKISSQAFEQEAYYLSKEHLDKLGVAQLKKLRAKFPENEALGRVLLGKLYKEGNWEYELPLIEKLEAQYNPNASVVAAEEVKKVSYNVGVILPFKSSQINTYSPKASFVLDLYEGMKLAQKALNQMGANIQLHTFDTERDSSKTTTLLLDSELKKLDLIVGPIYPENIRLVQEFAVANNIPMVNPLREENWIAPDSIPSYLFSSDLQTQAEFACNYAFNELKSVQGYIIYGNKERDLLMAQAYRSKLESLGGEVAGAIQFSYDGDSYKNLYNALKPIATQQNAHVFVTSRELTVANTLISALQALDAQATILAPQRWMEIPQLSFSRMESADVHFYYPSYYDETSEDAALFRKNYLMQSNIYPSKYSYIGYGTLYFFGRMLQQFGLRFPEALSEGQTVSQMPIFAPLEYKDGHDNGNLMIGGFKKGTFQVLYPSNTAEKE